MPKIRAYRPETGCQEWLNANPCPPSEPGAACINLWILSAARAFRNRMASPQMAYDLIAASLTRPQKQPREIQRAVEKAYRTEIKGVYSRDEKLKFNPDLLGERASAIWYERIDWVDFLAAESPEYVLECHPGKFLDTLYEAGEVVWCGKHDADSGFLYHIGTEDPDDLMAYLKGSIEGAKFLVNPVTGTEIHGSWRSGPNITAYRYLMIESDEAPPDQWISLLVQMRAPISAICESGRRSVHALIRVNASSELEFKEIASGYRRKLIPFGLDKSCGKIVQLSRLPGILRAQTGKFQRLLYLDGDPDGTPIFI